MSSDTSKSTHEDTTAGAPGLPVGWALPVVTVLGVAAAIVAAFFGSGALGGTPISEAAGGALSSDATQVAPAGPAFSIWSVIYVGLAAYALWQLTATARQSPRQREVRPWALLSAVLNAVWIWTIQLELLVVSVAVILVLLAVLFRILVALGAPRTGGLLETVVVDGTFGLYLGWVSVAVLANIYAWLADAGATAFTELPLTVVGIAVAAGIGVVTALIFRGRIAPALATAWGLAWIAVGGDDGAHEAAALVWTATALVLVVAVATRIAARSR